MLLEGVEKRSEKGSGGGTEEFKTRWEDERRRKKGRGHE